MKYSNINVGFNKPENEIKTQLARIGAKDIVIRRIYGDEIEVRYTLKCANPEKEILTLLSNFGARDIRSSSSFCGARFDYKLDDLVDEREFKRKVQESLRKSGYKVN